MPWRSGPDFVILLAPVLGGLAAFIWPRLRHSQIMVLVVIAISAALLGRGDLALLEHLAAAHGYHACDETDVWTPSGDRGGQLVTGWNYTKDGCPKP